MHEGRASQPMLMATHAGDSSSNNFTNPREGRQRRDSSGGRFSHVPSPQSIAGTQGPMLPSHRQDTDPSLQFLGPLQKTYEILALGCDCSYIFRLPWLCHSQECTRLGRTHSPLCICHYLCLDTNFAEEFLRQVSKGPNQCTCGM